VPASTLPTGFLKNSTNLSAAVALSPMHESIDHMHQTLRLTPAIEAGDPDHVWSIEVFVAQLAA